MSDRVVTLARWRNGASNGVSSRRALLSTSALVGLSLCLLSSGASAAQPGADACSAALAGKSRAAIEQFLREYPAGDSACLATATTSAPSGNARGGHGNGPAGSGPSAGNGGGSGHGSSGSAAAAGNGGGLQATAMEAATATAAAPPAAPDRALATAAATLGTAR